MSPSSAAKRDREQAKRQKAEAKRQRRQGGMAASSTETEPSAGERPAPGGPAMSTDDLLRRIEEVHRLHDDGRMSDDEFQETKADLLSRLRVD